MIDSRILYGLFCALLVFSDQRENVEAVPVVPCFFIFGDSMVDNGNNNNLKTHSRVNYSPYGIDFPDGPTGRFTNGRTTADFFGEEMGFDDFIPPFAKARDKEILRGVNYASGAAGILDETGRHVGKRIPLRLQLRNHKTTIAKINQILGNKFIARRYLGRCLYLMVFGNNDYINNYFIPRIYNSSRVYTPTKFARFLTIQYAKEIKRLYDYGARKIALTAVASVGCTPNATATHDTKGSICVDKMNDAAYLFNGRLQLLAEGLNVTLPGVEIAYLKTFSIVSEYVTKDSSIEIKGCCPVNNYGLCIPKKKPCDNRAFSLFWDSFHPSETMNQIAAAASYIDLQAIL